MYNIGRCSAGFDMIVGSWNCGNRRVGGVGR